MPYVYSANGQPVPPAVEVLRVPPGISSQYPLGGFFTEDGVQVTKLKADNPFGSPLQGQQDAGAFTKIEASPSLQAQLDRIEAKVDQVLAK